jgi:hypothetical protein
MRLPTPPLTLRSLLLIPRARLPMRAPLLLTRALLLPTPALRLPMRAPLLPTRAPMLLLPTLRRKPLRRRSKRLL